jgi:hypothetical protein
MDRCVIIIINTCVKCTAFCLFGRALAPIPSTLCSISLHQPRATSPERLLLASVERNVLLSNIIISPRNARNLRDVLHKMLALCPIKVSASGTDSTTDILTGYSWQIGTASMKWICTCENDWKIVWPVPASHAQQCPQEWPVTCRVWPQTVYPVSL